MDIKIIKELTKLMRENDLIEIEVEAAELKIKLKKAGSDIIHHQAAPVGQPPPPAQALAPVAPSAAPAAPVDEFAGCTPIISPIPGTVYVKPNPDAKDFVAVGSQIDPTKVVCPVEAMKVFNEIKPDAGINGTIRKICVKDGQPVEYGTVLFLVG